MGRDFSFQTKRILNALHCIALTQVDKQKAKGEEYTYCGYCFYRDQTYGCTSADCRLHQLLMRWEAGLKPLGG
jgi:hypothetical protein